MKSIAENIKSKLTENVEAEHHEKQGEFRKALRVGIINSN